MELALRPDTEAERAAAFMEACGSRYSAPHIRRHYELAAAALRTPDSAVPAPDGRENDG